MFHSFFKPKTLGANNAAGAHLIELRKLSKEYRTGDGLFFALKNVNLTIDRGEFIAIIGKSGSGKSTLINMITGIDRPTKGEVVIDHIAVHKLPENKMARWRGLHIGVVFQFFQLLPTLTLLENVMLPMDLCHTFAASEREDRALHLLGMVELADHAHKLPAACSGGQQQRAAIARALANDPPLLVADEPTGNLDSRTAAQVFALFHRLVADGKTVLMVTHDNDMAQHVTRAVTMADGEVVREVSSTHALQSWKPTLRPACPPVLQSQSPQTHPTKS